MLPLPPTPVPPNTIDTEWYPYECYNWDLADYEAIRAGGADEPYMCTSASPNNIWTGGNNANYQGCNTCGCCQPSPPVTIQWPIGSIVQCLQQNGSLGTAYMSMPISSSEVFWFIDIVRPMFVRSSYAILCSFPLSVFISL